MSFAGYVMGQFVMPSGVSVSATNNGGGPTTVNFTPGSYFLEGLLNHMQSALQTQRPPSSGNWLVSYSATTGQVTIGMSAGTFSFASPFSTSDLATILGFTSNPTAVASATGSYQAVGLWIPNRPILVEGSDPAMAPIETDLRTTRSPRGKVIGIGGGNAYHVHRRVMWEHVERGRVWQDGGGLTNASWERFVIDVQLGRGHAWFRPSSLVRIADHTGSFVGIGANNGGGVAGWYMEGLTGINPRRSIDQWTGAFTIEIPRIVAEPEV